MCHKCKNLKPYGFLSVSFFVCAVLCCGSAAAQSAVDPNAISVQLSRDERLNLLKARQAELEQKKTEAAMERAELELSDTQALAQENIVTDNELRKAQQTYKEAIINYEQAKNRLEQTRLEFLKNATLIRVVSCSWSIILIASAILCRSGLDATSASPIRMIRPPSLISTKSAPAETARTGMAITLS